MKPSFGWQRWSAGRGGRALRQGWTRWLERVRAGRESGWRARLRPHLVPALYGLSAALLIHAVFPASPFSEFVALEEGTVPREDVIAEIGFSIPKSEAGLLRERREAAAAVPPIFVLEPAFADSARERLSALFVMVDSLTRTAPDVEAARRAVVAAGRRFRLDVATEEQVEVLRRRQSRVALQRAVQRVFREVLPRGYTTSDELANATATRVVVRGARGERLISRDSILTTSRFYEAANARVPSGFSVPEAQLFQALVVRFAEPTLSFDRAATETAREQARAAVNPILGEVLANERIVRAHERVTAEEITRLRAYQAALAQQGMGEDGGFSLGRVAGSVLLNALVLTLLGLALLFYRRDIYTSPERLGVVWGLILAVMVAAGAAARADAPVELIPVALLGVSLAVLYGAPLALAGVFAVALLVASRPPFLGLSALLTVSLAGAVSAMSVRVVRRRVQILACAATIAGAYVLAEACLALLHASSVPQLAVASGLGVGNAIVSASLAFVVFLPVFEKLTGITTDLTLLELADMNRPLLRRLSLEAPGTYAHSINVANLAEAAAHAVGANELLVRVGIYYHDIGKLRRPHFFVENQRGGPNPHERLKPEVSAAVVREHVLEGLQMAREAGLPEAVRAFVTEHHGTARIGFFYEKAQEARPGAAVDDGEFRYPGPKPQSRETAIAMLADSVESATRALQEPTPERIRELIDRVVARKLEEEQLDEAPLTLRDFDLIKAKFADLLSGLYHHRIDYPLTAEMAQAAGSSRAAGPA